MINGFGQTEGAGCVLKKFYHRLDGDERDLKRLTSVGQATTGDAGRDPRRRTTAKWPPGTIGEICFRSANRDGAATGTIQSRRSKRCATAGCTPATSGAWTRTVSSTWSTARRT